MLKIPTTLDLFKAGVHFGHRTGKCHPAMKPHIHTVQGTVHIIDLEKTRQHLKEALDYVIKIASEGGQILFLGTKESAKEAVKKAAEEAGCPYVVERWLGGTLTNFSVISRKIENLKKMEKEKKEGQWAKYTKKEQLDMERELVKLKQMVGGIRELTALPQLLYIVDLGKEATAVREARRKNIPIVAMVDTNANPGLADFPVPANDDGIKSIKLITGLVVEAIKEGRKKKSEAGSKKSEVKKENKK